jgi:hypothetical protein
VRNQKDRGTSTEERTQRERKIRKKTALSLDPTFTSGIPEMKMMGKKREEGKERGG